MRSMKLLALLLTLIIIAVAALATLAHPKSFKPPYVFPSYCVDNETLRSKSMGILYTQCKNLKKPYRDV